MQVNICKCRHDGHPLEVDIIQDLLNIFREFDSSHSPLLNLSAFYGLEIIFNTSQNLKVAGKSPSGHPNVF